MSAEGKSTKDEIQRNRNEAYQGGWGDGYAEGFGKATDLSQASVAAALEAAAELLDSEADDLEASASRFRGGTNPYHSRMDLATVLRVRASNIRDLITPAQHDALAAHVAAEVAKARAEDASEIAQLEQDLDDMRDNAESAYRRGYFEGRNGA